MGPNKSNSRTPIEKLIYWIRSFFMLSIENTTPMFINDQTLRKNIDGYAVQAISSDAAFSVLKLQNEHKESNGAVNMTLPAGQIVYLRITDIQLAGGDVYVYTKQNK